MSLAIIVSVNVLVQHIHMCLWPHLISPFISLGTRSSDPEAGTSDPRARHRDSRGSVGGYPEKEVPPSRLKVELVLATNDISVAVANNPSDTTSCGLCAEVRKKTEE